MIIHSDNYNDEQKPHKLAIRLMNWTALLGDITEPQAVKGITQILFRPLRVEEARIRFHAFEAHQPMASSKQRSYATCRLTRSF
jgi:hypothetical protein